MNAKKLTTGAENYAVTIIKMRLRFWLKSGADLNRSAGLLWCGMNFEVTALDNRPWFLHRNRALFRLPPFSGERVCIKKHKQGQADERHRKFH